MRLFEFYSHILPFDFFLNIFRFIFVLDFGCAVVVGMATSTKNDDYHAPKHHVMGRAVRYGVSRDYVRRKKNQLFLTPLGREMARRVMRD